MCPDCQSLNFTGQLRVAGKEWVDEVFKQNPGMNEVYPGESRYILDAFHIYEGRGEWFDLLNYPINRALPPMRASRGEVPRRRGAPGATLDRIGLIE